MPQRKRTPVTPEEMEFTFRIGQRIRQLREKKGYTRRLLAELVGMSYSSLEHIECWPRDHRYVARIQFYQFFILCKVLGVRMSVLCPTDKTKPRPRKMKNGKKLRRRLTER